MKDMKKCISVHWTGVVSRNNPCGFEHRTVDGGAHMAQHCAGQQTNKYFNPYMSMGEEGDRE